MPKRRLEEVIVAEHVLEVRTEASGSFLDVRGFVADYIHAEGLFPHWQIEQHIIQFRDTDSRIDKLGAFVGYRSIGYIAFNPDTRNFFTDKASSFWKHVLKNPHYKVPNLRRFGSRTKAFVPADVPFEQLCNRAFKTYFSKASEELLGSPPKDLQFILDSSAGDFNTRIIFGPTKEQEATRYFSFPSEHLSKPGIYVDVDCFSTEGLRHDQVPGMLKRSMDIIWARVEHMAAALDI